MMRRMARATVTDPPMMFRFSLTDVEDGYLGLSAIKVRPDGQLNGPGQVTIVGAFRAKLVRFMEHQSPRNLEIAVFDRVSGIDRPERIVHLTDVRPWAGRAGPIEWDATKSEVLLLRARMPYARLVVTSGNILERIAAQA